MRSSKGQRSGGKAPISVQSIRADTDEHLWSGTSDREVQDVLALQSDVTAACLLDGYYSKITVLFP
jgi:TolB-like protein